MHLRERPLMAESCPSFQWFSRCLNVRFREKRTFSLKLQKTDDQMAAMRSKADIKLELAKRAANDSKRTLVIGHRPAFQLL